MKGFFITGTDTDCGKTEVACALIRQLRGAGHTVAPFKPVAAGAELVDGQWRNDDALRLIEAAGWAGDYHEVNPYCFEDPVSPHLAAAKVGQTVDLPEICEKAENLARRANFVIVEGAGGWLVPLSRELDIATLARALGLPVVLVVGLRLGCLNHARLSEQVILASGLPLAGWVASRVDPQMALAEQNLDTLRDKLGAPFLGVLDWQAQGLQGGDLSCLL